MDDSMIEERKSPLGYLVRVEIKSYKYTIFKPDGELEKNVGTVNEPYPKVPKIVFMGKNFQLPHFHLGELIYLNTRKGKMIIPYNHSSAKGDISVGITCFSESDIFPAMLYHYQDLKEFVRANEEGYVFKHAIVDENFPKSDMIHLKIRYSKLNIFIHKINV